MPLGRFLAYSLAGTTLWMGGLGIAGYKLGEHYQAVAHYVEPVTKIVVLAVVAIYVVRLVRSFRPAGPR
jgi:membrane protein DedA with SNARE-associated domain